MDAVIAMRAAMFEKKSTQHDAQERMAKLRSWMKAQLELSWRAITRIARCFHRGARTLPDSSPLWTRHEPALKKSDADGTRDLVLEPRDLFIKRDRRSEKAPRGTGRSRADTASRACCKSVPR